jgi:hypothetical protein
MFTRLCRRPGLASLGGLASLAGTMRLGGGLLGLGLMMLVACGSRRDDRAKPPPEDGRARVEEAPAPLPPVTPLPLGKSALAEFTYNRGTAIAALERAIAAEAAGDWAAAGAAAEEALQAVPGNLEAAWILAMMRARMGQTEGVLEPLSMAVAGDWLRWGERSRQDPALAGFLASPHGERFRELAEIYDQGFRQTLAEDLLIVGRRAPPRHPARTGTFRVNHRSEIYAYDAESGRYVRASRTDGALVGYVRAPSGTSLLHASYRRVRVPAQGAPALLDVSVGGVDLEQARTLGEVVFDEVARIEIGYRHEVTRPGAKPASGARPAPGAAPGPGGAPAELVPVARVQSARDGTWRMYALDLAAGVARPLNKDATDAADAANAMAAGKLIVSFDEVRVDRLPVDGVMADWDDAGTAGAFRIARTRKTVTLAAGESVDGHSMAWSPARARLAFATAAIDRCGAEAEARRVTLYAVDATTGALHPVATGQGDFAPLWLDDTRLAYVQEIGPEPAANAAAGTAPAAGTTPASGAVTPVVVIVDVVTGAELARLEGPAGVGTTHLPRHRCPAPAEPAPAAAPAESSAESSAPPDTAAPAGPDAP